MALDVTAGSLMAELRAAEEQLDRHLHGFDGMVARFHGQAYDRNSTDSYRENHYADWIGYMVPRLVWNNPRVKVTSKRAAADNPEIQALHHGVNRWVRDVDLRRFLIQPAIDMQFNWSVIVVSPEPTPGARPIEGMHKSGKKDLPWSPRCYRIDQRRFFIDPLATSMEEVRWCAHKWVRDKEDLLEEAKSNPKLGWSVEYIEGLSEDTGLEEYGRDRDTDHIRRGEIVGVDFWVPEYRVDEKRGPKQGFHGTIISLAGYESAGSGEAEYLREPRPFYGPRSGPYTVMGVDQVPGDPFPLGPLTKVQEQISELNSHAEAASRSAADYKRLGLVMNGDNKLTQIIKDGKHDYIFNAAMDPDAKVVQLELGGITAQQITMLELLTARLQRVSGLTDMQRGLVSGRGTATEQAIADQASDVRTGWVQSQFAEGVRKVLSTVAWYLWHDNRVAFPLGPDVMEELGISKVPAVVGGQLQLNADGMPLLVEPEVMFKGGSKSRGVTFDDLELEIEPFSMERTSEATLQQRSQRMLELVTGVAPLIPQLPWVRWKEVFDKLGEAWNQPDLGSLIDEEIAMQVAGADPQMAGPDPQRPQLVSKSAKPYPFAQGQGRTPPGPPQVGGPERLPDLGQQSGSAMQEVM